MKGKKALKPGSVLSIFPFLKPKPERELSYKRVQIKEKFAQVKVLHLQNTFLYIMGVSRDVSWKRLLEVRGWVH